MESKIKNMIVKIKKLNEKATIPSYSKPGDAGMDLIATEISLSTNENEVDIATVKSGLAIEIPEGFVGYLFPRSSIYKNSAILSNSVGVIDSGYRGEIMANFLTSNEVFGYKVGDKFAQLIIMPIPPVQFKEVTELSSTERGEGGFGSTGK